MQISVESIFILIICMDSLSNCFILVFLWLTRLFLFSLCKLIHVRVHYFISVFIKDRMTESRLSYISATGLIIAYLDIALEMVRIKSFSYVLLINFKARRRLCARWEISAETVKMSSFAGSMDRRLLILIHNSFSSINRISWTSFSYSIKYIYLFNISVAVHVHSDFDCNRRWE